MVINKKLKITIFFLYLFFVLICICSVQDNRPIITILDFEVSGITREEAKIVVDFITTHFGRYYTNLGKTITILPP